MSSLARKFGMSHLLPTETVIYPTGQHQHHVEPCSFNQQPQNINNQQNETLLQKFSFCQRNNNQDQPTHPYPSYPKQKEYQQQKKSLPTSIKMDTTPSDKLTSVPVSNNSRVGDQQLLSNGNLNASTMAGSNSVSPRRICSDNNIHMIGSSDNGMIGGGIDPGGGSAAAAVKKRSITSMVETFLDEHKEFLDNYVRRKVSRARLENWLYRPNTQTPHNSRSSSPGLPCSSGDNISIYNGGQETIKERTHRSSEPMQFSNSIPSPSSRNSSYGRLPLVLLSPNLHSPSSTLQLNTVNKLEDQTPPGRYHRERSLSTVITPASRRMSAASFIGCQTPLLSTNNETGQLSFLRSNNQNKITSISNQITSQSQSQTLPTSYEYSQSSSITLSREALITPTNLPPLETNPTITLNDKSPLGSPSGVCSNFEKTNSFLQKLKKIVSSEDVEGFCISVNEAVKCLFSDKLEISGIFVVQGEAGNKKVDSGGLCGDLYLLDKEDLVKVENHAVPNRLSKHVMTSLQVTRANDITVNLCDDDNQGYNAMIAPLIDHNKHQVLGTIQVYNRQQQSSRNSEGTSSLGFSNEDEIMFSQMSELMSSLLASLVNQQEMRLDLTRSQVFLELARTVFQEQDHLEPTMVTILSNFLQLIDCARCQILLSDPSDPTVFKRVFDMTKEECASLDCDSICDPLCVNTNDNKSYLSGQKRALPVNAAIASEVARTNRKVNLRNLPLGDENEELQNNDRQNSLQNAMSNSLSSLEGDMPNMNENEFINSDGSSSEVLSTTHCNSFLCMAIRDPDDNVLGVISLIDKESGDGSSVFGMVPAAPTTPSGMGYFTENDEQFVKAFSIFCGMAIRNAAEYEKAVVSEAKYQVAFEVMNYQAAASEVEAHHLAEQQRDSLPAASTFNIDTFCFDYLTLNDSDTLKATLRMFVDLGLLNAFNIDYDTLCRWLLTVKRNYRNETVQYHNWYHAFNVAQMMFCMLTKANWIDQKFQPAEILGMLVACICHDLDHRGTNNTFERKRNNPLARLYSTSTLERHHLNHCLLLLNIKGNGILDNLSKDEYSLALQVIESCILATDLEQHFRHRDEITEYADMNSSLYVKSQKKITVQKEQFLLQSALMTAADLGAVTKPWSVHRHVSQLIAEEFWKQGDLERSEFHIEPPPVLDRHASLSAVQLGFIDNICRSHYEDMVKLSSDFAPMLEGCLANRSKWVSIEEGKEDKDEGDKEDENCPVKAAINKE